MTIKSYRGLMADGATLRINLRTNDGKTGYRIKKFEAIPNAPGVGSSNHVLKIFKTEPTIVASSTIDFSDQDLIGSLWMRDNVDANYVSTIESIIFDQEVFNQDIFITHVETVGSEGCNYFIELEQIKLTDNETTMATLQSIRSSYESYRPAGPS